MTTLPLPEPHANLLGLWQENVKFAARVLDRAVPSSVVANLKKRVVLVSTLAALPKDASYPIYAGSKSKIKKEVFLLSRFAAAASGHKSP